MDAVALDAGLSHQEIVLTFANTHGFGRSADRLVDGPGLLAWLEEIAWLGASHEQAQITDADAAEARELRDALTVVLLSNAQDPNIDGAQREAAEGILRRGGDRYPLAFEIDCGHTRLRAARPGLAGVFGQVLASIISLSLSGEWARMKACRNEPCQRAFIDHSRNTSARYCRPQCSSQASMRAYRARRRGARRGGTQA